MALNRILDALGGRLAKAAGGGPDGDRLGQIPARFYVGDAAGVRCCNTNCQLLGQHVVHPDDATKCRVCYAPFRDPPAQPD